MNSTAPANSSAAGAQTSRSKAKTEDSGSDDEMTPEQKGLRKMKKSHVFPISSSTI
jgi:hypothetical protein